MQVTNIAVASNERFDTKKLRKAFEEIHPVQFVDQKEEDDALAIYCRFKGENSVAKFLEILAKLKAAEEVDERLSALHEIFEGAESFNKLKMEALQGVEELKYWQVVKELMKSKYSGNQNGNNKCMCNSLNGH